MSDVILSSRDLSKSYRMGGKEVRAVDKVSFDLAPGASICVVGPSGAGKSTLLQLLGGLDFPTTGNVMLDGIDIYKLSDKERARIRNKRIGFVFQFYHLLPEFSAIENVMLPAMIGRRKAKEKALDILKSVGLADRAAHRPGELSGGESQRVAIARALINDPEVLLCDEPTGNLDSATSESIYQLLSDIKSKSGAALVIVTHDDTLSKRTDSTLRLKDGRIV
ncbi:MAG: ABC transporter ATP-binding protein [Candidatus Omnitrophica bacterium]|nr:ABC transporter ATP-binding protein [Candidatus Omnitrophota bacterium]MBU1808826.1 ABC transporter ATP-binding protein [Candidatus Omnitrophota bacterium]